MFKNLRNHRRSPSNPTSPIPEQPQTVEAADVGHAHPRRHQDGNASQPLSKLSQSPALLPITRAHTATFDGSGDARYGNSMPGIYEKSAGTRTGGVLQENIRPQDAHLFSNHQRMTGTENQRPGSAGNAPTSKFSSQYLKQQPSASEVPLPKQNPPESNFLPWAASDSQSRPVKPTRRATGARLATPPPEPVPAPTFENAPSKSRRMNLLNPMSLLARRRTSQAVSQLSAESLVANRTTNPGQSYLGIRGTVVHDFSAPRPRRVVSSEDSRLDDKSGYFARSNHLSPNARAGENGVNGSLSDQRSPGHTPVFTENFEEEQYPAAGPHVRKANDLSDLTLPKPPYAKGAPRQPEPNPVVSDTDNLQKHYQNAKIPRTIDSIQDIPPAVPPRSKARFNPPAHLSIEPTSSPPKATASTQQGRSRKLSEVSSKDVVGSNLPKHMKSTSSRFSFDMIGAAEQERLLEDRHRQRALEKKLDNADAQEEDYEDDYDYDNMDDEDMEEDIPLVGDDYDEEAPNIYTEEDIPVVGDDEFDGSDVLNDDVNISRFTFQQSILSPLSPNSPGMVSTPRDANGEVIGFAMTKNSPYPPMDAAYDLENSIASSISTDVEAAHLDMGLQTLDINEFGTYGTNMPDLPHGTRDHISKSEQHDYHQPTSLDDDDMYFDDGLIDELGDVEEGSGFDESVFDNDDTDQYGRPLHRFSTQPTLYSPPNLTSGPSRSYKNVDEGNEDYSNNTDTQKGDASHTNILPFGTLNPQASISRDISMDSSQPSTGLTQDTLAAYQSALAQAAFNAAANGKFRRDSTPGPTFSESGKYQPGLVTDSGHDSHCETFSPSHEVEDDFDYDDALEDDAIIAAANAEALAYDTDGFYGQEFGFYSAPAGEAEYTNGGYFGSRGADGVIRSKSGRIADHERNLTPITERSEYSNRNSFMSIPHHQRPESLASPGLAHLLSSPGYESDMSLDALMKLRRGAWGGSQVSLHSSVGSPRSVVGADDSPVGQYPPWAQGGAISLPMGGGHRRANSSFSLVSEAESESTSQPSSPTLTMANFIMPAAASSEDKGVDAGKNKNITSSGSIS